MSLPSWSPPRTWALARPTNARSSREPSTRWVCLIINFQDTGAWNLARSATCNCSSVMPSREAGVHWTALGASVAVGRERKSVAACKPPSAARMWVKKCRRLAALQPPSYTVLRYTNVYGCGSQREVARARAWACMCVHQASAATGLQGRDAVQGGGGGRIGEDDVEEKRNQKLSKSSRIRALRCSMEKVLLNPATSRSVAPFLEPQWQRVADFSRPHVNSPRLRRDLSAAGNTSSRSLQKRNVVAVAPCCSLQLTVNFSW